MTNTEKILAEFDELLSHFKNSKELPNTAVNELRRKTNTQLENEIKAFLTTKITQALAEERERVKGEIEKQHVFTGRDETDDDVISKDKLLASLDTNKE